mgnify:CR=1 FL=1
MRQKDNLQLLRAMCPDAAFAENEPLSAHTSFRIGGPAALMAFPKNEDELAVLLRAASQCGVKPRILGAGTNVLAPDEGLDGLVICTKDCLLGLRMLEGGRIEAMAGETLAHAAVFARGQSLTGLEFAHGIPGTLGGGVYMNAGAYGGEICQICESVEVMDLDGNLSRLSNAEMAFSYRHSALENRPGIVVSADFALKKGNPEEIWAKMKDLIARRTASQPLDFPSAGSPFKRPTGGYAAALIEEAGLKGYQVGGAAISAKHAGFAVNLGGATAADVKALLSQVSEQVYQKSGIRLEPEVRIW